MPSAQPCAIVIFGASGDLAKRKLIPAIYELAREKLLNEKSYIVGYSRSPMSDEAFRKDWRESIQQFARSKPIDEALWKSLAPRIYYTQADYGSPEDHARVGATLAKLDKKFGCDAGCRLFYLATPPQAFEPIILRLGERKVMAKDPPPGHWQRIIIEKPFGHDLKTAQALNATLHKFFDEDQVFRIDHYLGK